MNRHPAVVMLCTWVLCAAAWFVLPYRLIERRLTGEGMAMLAIFIAAFVVGTLLVLPGRRAAAVRFPELDAGRALSVLAAASVLATFCFLMDAQGKSLFDLALAYEIRSEAADALLKGEASSSSAWFQAGFLLYPAGFVYTAVHIIYVRTISFARVALLGLLPIGLATLGMGGRVPIFYAMLVLGLALRERRRLPMSGPELSRRRGGWVQRAAWIFSATVLFGYFAAVFMIRAEVAGGAAGMFDVAAERWGVAFDGALSPFIFGIFGESLTYLIFVFIWYLVQGLVMSNIIFSEYDGPMQFGVYGLDLMSAVMRRIDPDGVAQGFDALMALGTYGFLPSAWGSLYVDLGLFGLLPALLWGMFAALAHRRVFVQGSQKWRVVGPFVTLGIVFSLINTPLGFTNGLVTHAWLLAAFMLLRRAAPQRTATMATPAVPAVT